MPAMMKTPCRGKGSSQNCGTCAVVALADEQQTQVIRRALTRLGWQVREAGSAAAARRLVRAGVCSVAILATELYDESGWLTCAKLKLMAQRVDVYLVGPNSPRNRCLARFVGAAALLGDPVEIADWLRPSPIDALR
jgi:DNA-binding response OmpR family regulator